MVIEQKNGIEIVCDWCAKKLSDHINSFNLPKDHATAYRIAETFGIKSVSGGERCSNCV
jgi:hypothetical protein